MLIKLFKYRFLFLQYAFILVTLLYCTNAGAASLNEAFISSYQTNPQIKSAIQALQLVDEETPSALSGMLPTANASLQRGEQDAKITGIPAITSITDTKSLNFTQPLFKGGHTYASLKKAKNDVMAAREQLRNTEQQVFLDAAGAYMDVVTNQEVLELAKSNISVLEHHLDAVQERFKHGDITKTDVSQSKASLAKAHSDLISAELTLETSKATYEKTIGQTPINVAMPKTPIELQGSVDELINIALANNPTIKMAEYNWDASKDDINIQKSALLPQLSAFATRQRQYGIVPGEFAPINNDSSTFGVNLSIPLYQGGSEYSQVRQAKHVAGRNSYNLAVARNDVREAVIKAFQNFRVAQSLIKSNQSSVDAFSIALEGAQEEALAGLRTNIEVLDAEQSLFDAKTNLVKSKSGEIVSSYNLLAQLGKLTVKELDLKVDAYNPEENYNKVKHQIIGF